ncbi:MAG: GNAT family N-acetyltransferase [Burkholderiales bacterium]|nr:GNAT family N-acetyltransferase [Burkholderiales bacterium]
MPLTVAELNPRVHDREGFDCGVEPLNRYLRSVASQHRAKGFSTTFVLVDDGCPEHILGYYSLSAASIAFDRITDADRKNLPAYPIPAARIGRLAVSSEARKLNYGEQLLQNAIKRIIAARKTMGVFAVVVEAKDEHALSFYKKYGFRLCNDEERQLYLPIGLYEA